jgi:histidyl-tRNA synthetase
VGFERPRLLVNDRRVLVATLEPFATAGTDVFSIIRAIDKLDRQPEEAVVEELSGRGLDADRAREAFGRIREAPPSANLQAILSAIEALGVPAEAVVYTPTLARGLDYYTGAIFEVTVEGFTAGSLAGGGRYDDLLAALGGPPTPAVGLAFGFDRMVEAAEELGLVGEAPAGARVLVTLFDEATRGAALEAARRLRGAGIPCEVHPGEDKLGRQFKLADQKRIPLVAIVGPDELRAGTVTLRDMRTSEQQSVPRDLLVDEVQRRLAAR